MTRNQSTELAFEASIFDTLKLAARIMFYDPRFAVRALRLLSRQRRAANVRRIHKARGVHVPPFSIFSITGKCNLSCAGCYANLLHRSDRPELSNERIGRLLSEARDLWSRKEWVEGLLAQIEQVEEKDENTTSPGLLAQIEQVEEKDENTTSPELLAVSSRPGEE